MFVSGSSTSPEDIRPSARETMRTILKKSGSESDAFDPALTNFKENNFNLYASVSNDPLLNLDVLNLSHSPDTNQISPSDKDKLKPKTTLTRSISESVVSKKFKDGLASEILDNTIHEDDVFPVKKSEEMIREETLKKKQRDLEASRSIFSDSETVEAVATTSKVAKEKKMKHTHKRSRSDISGIKTSSMEKDNHADKTVKESSPEHSGLLLFCSGEISF